MDKRGYSSIGLIVTLIIFVGLGLIVLFVFFVFNALDAKNSFLTRGTGFVIGQDDNSSNNISQSPNPEENNETFYQPITPYVTGGIIAGGSSSGGSGSGSSSQNPILINWPPQDLQTKKFYVYSWPDQFNSNGNQTSLYNYFQHITPMYWVGAGGGNIDNPVEEHVTLALQHTSLMPAGHKTIKPRNVEDWIFFYKNISTNISEDHCRDSFGNLVYFNINLTGLPATSLPHLPNNANYQLIQNVTMPCLWFDNGKNFTKEWYNQFFNSYKNQTGELDVLSLDIEPFQNLWSGNIREAHTRCLENRTFCPISWCEALQNDPKYPPENFLQEIINLTYTVCNQTSLNLSYYSHMYDEYVIDRIVKYQNESLYDVAIQYFPNVKMSDYFIFNWNASYNVPYGGFADFYLYGDGAHSGTHQAPVIYGDLNLEDNMANVGLPNYQPNAYNAFKFDLNYIRSAHLSNPAPIMSWITGKSYPLSLLITDLYQENILHAGLVGTDQFIYWIPYLSQMSDLVIINSTLEELQFMTGYEGIQYLTTNITPWYENYTYTGARIGSYKVWRFTPNVLQGQTINDFIISSGSNSGNSAARFSIDGKIINFPNAMIYAIANPVSSNGAWVIQLGNAGNPFIEGESPITGGVTAEDKITVSKRKIIGIIIALIILMIGIVVSFIRARLRKIIY